MCVRVLHAHVKQREARAGTHALIDGNLRWDSFPTKSNGEQYASMIQEALAPLGLERPRTAGDVSDFAGYRDFRPQLPLLPRRRARKTDSKDVDDAPLSPLSPRATPMRM